MKRYWLFCGDEYYPKGGMEDFIGSYDSYAVILKQALEYINDEFENGSPWVHIYDSEILRIVWRYDDGKGRET